VTRATKETEAGRRYLDLQRKAKQTGRPTDELIQRDRSRPLRDNPVYRVATKARRPDSTHPFCYLFKRYRKPHHAGTAAKQ
jgi:hypothetical protein